jgi:hypothetical protein
MKRRATLHRSGVIDYGKLSGRAANRRIAEGELQGRLE